MIWQKNLSVFKNLKTIKGFSNKWAHKICFSLGIDETILYSQLSKEKINKLEGILSLFKKHRTDFFNENKLIGRDLDVYIKSQISLLIHINTHRGRRIKLGYPAHGQRTWSNGRTAKKLSKKYKNIK